MAKRIRIGIIFSYEEKWIGGTYYCLSIIKALNFLSDDQKPQIVAFVYKNEDKKVLQDLNYPYLTIHKLDVQSKFLRRLDLRIKQLSRWRIQPIDFWRNRKIDVVYLFRHDIPYFKALPNKVFWVADFQEFVLRSYFTDEEFEIRSAVPRYVADTNYTLIVSSEDSKRDFVKFFPNHQCQVRVVHFASLHPELNGISIDSLKEKYGITKRYFLCANQFWQHKNHMIILKALMLMPEKERSGFQVIFTGKNFDYRTNNYFPSLEKFIKENNLGDCVKYIGFIDRKEQLILMDKAEAVIQPSLFEGWSTSVEDAKHLNQLIILSNISVHKEQRNENGILFDPNDEGDLADKMQKTLNGGFKRKEYDYAENIKSFASDFIQAINGSLKIN